jgi:hypothetical protein
MIKGTAVNSRRELRLRPAATMHHGTTRDPRPVSASITGMPGLRISLAEHRAVPTRALRDHATSRW